jgi:myo-inositol 2-dehydrogenase/D-chiro-inositol 1-dehydrogenase
MPSEPLRVAVAGVGRMGAVHLMHAVELEREGRCRLAGVADIDTNRARGLLARLGREVPVFGSIVELVASDVCRATFLATPTTAHRETALPLLRAGHRVLLEKPLTGRIEDDRVFSAELDRDHPQGVMLAFQRRFDAPLQHARRLMAEGAVGRVFKIYSALEDSGPAPNGYDSPGILSDMSIHNVDEVLWMTGRSPRSALVIGSRLHGYRLTTCTEDFDDAELFLWFEGDLAARIQVSRNHVSGYRNETTIYGQAGQIHVGRFEQKPFEVVVETYGPRGTAEPIDFRTFPMRDYGPGYPEFIDRYGSAYKAEFEKFIECCETNSPFPSTHLDGLRAQEAIAAGMGAVFTEEQAKRL